MFCIRILIIRLSPKTLSSLFANIWPMLLTFLMQVFSEQNLKSNLLLSALKLIELISIVAMEEFHIYQWIFVFDYFGLKFD